MTSLDSARLHSLVFGIAGTLLETTGNVSGMKVKCGELGADFFFIVVLSRVGNRLRDECGNSEECRERGR